MKEFEPDSRYPISDGKPQPLTPVLGELVRELKALQREIERLPIGPSPNAHELADRLSRWAFKLAEVSHHLAWIEAATEGNPMNDLLPKATKGTP